MRYPPNFKGLLKAVVDTIFKHHPKEKHPGKDSPGKEHYWRIKGYEIYEPDKDPGMEFWRARADEIAQKKEQEKIEKDKRIIEDYEFRHKDDIEVKAATDEPKAVVENKSFVTKDEDTTELAEEDADDFHADIGMDFDSLE